MGFPARGELSLWALDIPAGDVGTTPVITATASGGTNVYILIQEVSGLATGTTVAAMCDGTPGGAGGLTTAGGGTLASPVYVSALSSEYLLSCICCGTETFTAPGNLTADAGNLAASGGNSGIGFAYGNSTGGTESAAWGVSQVGSDQYAIILVAFKLPGGTNATVTMGSALAAAASQPAAQAGSLTSPAYATSYGIIAGGSGSWVNPANAEGTGGSGGPWATWTAPWMAAETSPGLELSGFAISGPGHPAPSSTSPSR